LSHRVSILLAGLWRTIILPDICLNGRAYLR
jgi:hypothetical protein